MRAVATMDQHPPSASEKLNAMHGRLLVLAATVMWSSSGLFAKAPTFHGWEGGALAIWRSAFACLVLFPLVRRPRWTVRLLPMSAFFAAMNFAFLTAVQQGEATNAIWLQYTAPVWVFLASAVWFREKVQPVEWLLLACTGAGVGLILFFELQRQSSSSVIFGLLAGVTFAGVILSLRWLRDQEAAWLMSVNFAVTTLALLALARFREYLTPYLEYRVRWPERSEQWLLLACFGVLQMGLPYILFARGLRSITGHEASGIGLLEPVLVPVWVWAAWHNSPTYAAPRWWTLAGGGLILVGLLIRYGSELRPPQRHVTNE